MKAHRSKIILIFLSVYIFLQFCWWGYLLIQEDTKKSAMVIGEGSFFMVILLFGIWRFFKSIETEIQLHKRQSNFLLSVTHELKTPLASVQLVLQTLLRRSFNAEQIHEFTEKALEENKKSQQLIETILQATGIEQNALLAQITVQHPQDFLTKLENSFQPQPPARIVFHCSTDTLFKGDVNMLTIVLKNLIDNSIKYGASEVIIRCFSNNNNLEFEVKDNGIGISVKDQPFIFDKFYRSGEENIRERSGTGLGLYISKEMMKLQGGKLNYLPSEKGACFVVSLPHAK
ncbi:MAG: sensor histidine kinase [Flavobacteriia bacterium]|nr:sensor histidine kinase [Flavobacteriia bacterium]